MYSYNELANYYDILMDDVDYEQWTDYIIHIYERLDLKPSKILDTACGTGNITIPMARRGYRMWGLDISEDMLSVAETKARDARQKIKFLKQNMAELHINELFDSILCMCDGVNYIIDEEELMSFFSSVYSRLIQGGVFIFDISSYGKLHNILGNNVLYEEKNNIYYVWDNSFDEAEDTVEMNLVFFVPEGGLYRKFEENHIQKAYKEQYLRELLTKAGFAVIQVYDAFRFDKSNEESDRIFFAATKK